MERDFIMAITESETKVKTFIQILYEEPADSLIRQEIHRVKDESTSDFVTVSDVTTDVGDKQEYKEGLQEQQEQITEIRDQQNEILTEQIELLQEQIDAIDSL